MMRIEDDAFIKICNMISDSSVRVRSLAAGLLGQFPHVSDKFLEQTLDKKLMSHLRVVKSEHERARELHQGGGGVMDWDTGQRWGGRVPRTVLDPSEVRLAHLSRICFKDMLWLDGIKSFVYLSATVGREHMLIISGIYIY